MPTGSCPRRVAACAAMLAVGSAVIAVAIMPAAQAGTAARPNLAKGSAYLVSPANLIDGHYYSSFPRTADFGLTIDGALALAATGDENHALKRIVSFLADGGRDATGKTVNDWTGIGTRYAVGGAIAKEALLAEVAAANPRDFGGRNLIAALDASVCPRAGAGGHTRCLAAGSYSYASSVFDEALGVMAQLRAGQHRQAAAPVGYLESLQHPDGSFPSLIPGSGADVDSTAMAVMALALVPGQTARADVSSGVAWIAGRQDGGGGFPGAGGDSVNSAGLAIQAMTLRRASYRSRIAAAEAFLARAQDLDGGFTAYAGGQPGSNLRASTQAVGGAVGTPFGSLSRDLYAPAIGRSGPGSLLAYLALLAIALALAAGSVTTQKRRRRRRHGAAPASRNQSEPAGRLLP